jgi:hypothetical protein
LAADKHVFLKNGNDLFLCGALEQGDHVEAVREISVFAPAIFAFEGSAEMAIARTDLPDETGQEPCAGGT